MLQFKMEMTIVIGRESMVALADRMVSDGVEGIEHLIQNACENAVKSLCDDIRFEQKQK